MKKTLTIIATFLPLLTIAQTFTTIKQNPITSVKDQNLSGTCWDYATLGFVESEILRIGWQEMLDDMRGRTQTYWDEVDEIISRGDDAIIEFLKQHTADYQEAGALQAQAYVDEWKKKLEDLAKAHTDIMGDITGEFDETST